MMKADASFRARSRAHRLILSGQGTTSTDSATTSQVHRVTVAAWVTNWEPHGPARLHETPRSGRPSRLSPAEQDIALPSIQAEPRALHGVMDRRANQTDKRLRMSSLQRRAQRGRLRWQRVRTSRPRLRDPGAFAKAKRAREALQHQEDHGTIAL